MPNINAVRTAESDDTVMTGRRQEKVKKVMKEFGEGKLKSSSGDKVTNRKQGVAIALSEARRAGKKS